MGVADALELFDAYDGALVVAGIAILVAAVAPRMLGDKPLSMPIMLLSLGFVVFALPLGLEAPDPLEETHAFERLTELGVIIALMGAGLKIDRPFSWRAWRGTWRLLALAMPLTIAAAALLGWWIAGFVPATAMLLGAVISPTDPVLATEVQVGEPMVGSEGPETEERDPTGAGEEDEVRFTLTSEAGLNDGLAFPYTNAAIAMTVAGAAPAAWIGTWIAVDVIYKLAIAILVGLALGRLLASVIMSLPAETEMAKAMTGMSAIAATLIIYGITQLLGGYGFIATFVGAVAIRRSERDHAYHATMHQVTEMAERLLTAVILLLLGGAIADGILGPLNLRLILVGLLLLFVVRPAAGALSLVGFGTPGRREKAAIAFFGVRGVGSLYYLSHALAQAEFAAAREIWALVAFVVGLSVIVHGVTAAPVVQRLDSLREELGAEHA